MSDSNEEMVVILAARMIPSETMARVFGRQIGNLMHIAAESNHKVAMQRALAAAFVTVTEEIADQSGRSLADAVFEAKTMLNENVEKLQKMRKEKC